MCTIRVFRELANQVAPRAGSVLRGQLKVHNSKSGTRQVGVSMANLSTIVPRQAKPARELSKLFLSQNTCVLHTSGASDMQKYMQNEQWSRETETLGPYCMMSRARLECPHTEAFVFTAPISPQICILLSYTVFYSLILSFGG